MKYLCMVLGYLTGKWKVRCTDCNNLKEGNLCYGHKMPDDVVGKTMSCGFFSKKPS